MPILPLVGPVFATALVSVWAARHAEIPCGIAEPSIAVLAAVGACWIWDRLGGRTMAATAGGDGLTSVVRRRASPTPHRLRHGYAGSGVDGRR